MMHSTPVVDAKIPSATPSGSQTLYLPLLALAVVILITLASLLWSHDHPYGFNWDESFYINQMHSDVSHFHADGIGGLIKAWLTEDTGRPPAFRILASPFAIVCGPSPFVLRTVSILFRVLTFWFLFAGVAGIAGRNTAGLAVIFLALCPDIVFFGTVFYNEYALYLATAGMCCFVFRNWDHAKDSLGNCLGLGVSLGIGALAKASFPALAGCFLLLVVVFRLRKKIAGPSPQFIVNACVIGALIAAPWWLMNFRSAASYADYALGSVRRGFGHPGIHATALCFKEFCEQGIGLPLAGWCIAVLVLAIIRHRSGRAPQISAVSAMPAVCALLAPLPLCLLSICVPDPLIYHVSATLILFAAGFALLAQRQGWMSSPPLFLVLNVTVFVQLALLLKPFAWPVDFPGARTAWTALARREQWDWNQLRVLLQSKGITRPSIGYLGGVGQLNPPGIKYPWVLHDEPPPGVTSLWQQGNGQTNLNSIVASATNYDVVLTSPDFTTHAYGDFMSDNLYNADFILRLRNSTQFQQPLHLRMGKPNPVDLLVFIRNNAPKE